MSVFARGQRVYLRPVQASDAELITSWKQDPVVRRMALGPDTEIDLAGQEKDIKTAASSIDELYVVIVIAETDEPVGYIRINWMDSEHRFVWLRFALGARRGEGNAKDALRCFLTRLFSLGLHRAEAEVYEFNQPSLGLLKSLGFYEEGRKRQAHYDGKGFADVVVLGLLKEHFPS